MHSCSRRACSPFGNDDERAAVVLLMLDAALIGAPIAVRSFGVTLRAGTVAPACLGVIWLCVAVRGWIRCFAGRLGAANG